MHSTEQSLCGSFLRNWSDDRQVVNMAFENTLVSVIVPVYRTENYLEQCVDSLLKQTYSKLEIILVDDGSPDGSPALCDWFAAQHENVRVIHKQNEGAAFARKSGLDAAAGEYVLFLDGDDWLDSDAISECMETAIRDSADCVMFGYVREYPGKSILNPLFDQDYTWDALQSEERVHRRIVGQMGQELRQPHRIDNLSSFCMRLLRTDRAREGKFISERIIGTSEDTIFNLYALDGCRISYINRCFYHYRKTDTSMIMSHKPDLADKWDVMYGEIETYINGSGKTEMYRTPFLNRLACGMIGLGLNEVGSSESLGKKAAKIRHILNKPLYREAFRQLDITPCGLKWKVSFLLCKARAAFLLTILLQIMNYLRSRVAA